MRRSDREFVRDHEGPLCILPRHERLARVKELFAATDTELAVQQRGVRLHEYGGAPERRGRRAAREACRRR